MQGVLGVDLLQGRACLLLFAGVVPMGKGFLRGRLLNFRVVGSEVPKGGCFSPSHRLVARVLAFTGSCYASRNLPFPALRSDAVVKLRYPAAPIFRVCEFVCVSRRMYCTKN